MKPLMILTAMTVIGLFGIIGTVEYAQAQTPLTLNPLPNTPEPTSQTLSLYSDPTKKEWYIAGRNNKTINIMNDTGLDETGHLFIHGNYPIVTEPHNLPIDTTEYQCQSNLHSVKYILTAQDTFPVSKIAIPENIKEQSNDTIIAMGFNWIYPSQPNDQFTCPINLEAPSKHPLIITKELIFTLYNQSDNKAYYFSTTDQTNYAQAIPLCTTNNLNTTDQTLKGDTKMCYGKHGNNMVIITKTLTGFYGATEQFVITEYMKLLQRLYLPPI